MKILLVAATENEIKPTLEFLEKKSSKKSFSEFKIYNNTIIPFITQVGAPLTAFALGRFHYMSSIQLLVHAGISGSYSESIKTGDVVEVISERFIDIGAEDQDNNIITSFDLGLSNKNQSPFTNGILYKKNDKYQTDLVKCNGLTVSYATGSNSRIKKILAQYNAEVESMEGAAVFYASRMWDVPFISIRSISNKVEPRNKENWNIALAIKNLNRYLIDYISKV